MTDPAPPARFALPRALRAAVAVTALGVVSLLLAAACMGLLQLGGNLHTVDPGAVYRSNQPTPERLAAYARDLGIRSVLNLRGSRPGDTDYEAEAEAARDLGLTLIDMPLSASRALSRDEVVALLAAMREAPKPLLIHCRSGADRTGLAAALYQALEMGLDEETAEWQLTPLYGHVPVPWLSQAWPMDETWADVEVWWGIES